jgi:caffeoyl-CoA O-methyltransferase
MSNKTLNLNDQLYQYLLNVSLKESEVLKALREETANLPEHNMQISPEQGQFMRLLVQLINGKRGIEIGVFTGYSALSVALGLPDDGQLIALDVSEEWTNVGRRYWEMAGVAHKIDLRIAPALDSLQNLVAEGKEETFDFAFIDADKENYYNYYEYCLQLLRPNGLIAIDNVLWSGKVAELDNSEAETVAIRALNQKLFKDDRIDLSLLPISDGLTLIRKK